MSPAMIPPRGFDGLDDLVLSCLLFEHASGYRKQTTTEVGQDKS